MIYIIAGDIGSGKTLRALTWMEDAIATGRSVYTNIQLTPSCPFHDKVVLIDTPGYPVCAEKPHPSTKNQFFWEYIPNDALIVIDEGDIFFDSTDFKIFGRDCRIYHKQSRKFKHDIVYIVQKVGNLYKRIRTLAGRIIIAEHTYKTLRIMGLFERFLGRERALGLSRFIYGEFMDERLRPRDLSGQGQILYSEAKRLFTWYDTKQLLGDTATVLKRLPGGKPKGITRRKFDDAEGEQ